MDIYSENWDPVLLQKTNGTICGSILTILNITSFIAIIFFCKDIFLANKNQEILL